MKVAVFSGASAATELMDSGAAEAAATRAATRTAASTEVLMMACGKRDMCSRAADVGRPAVCGPQTKPWCTDNLLSCLTLLSTMASELILPCQRHLFPGLAQSGSHVYLNGASMSPLLAAVQETGEKALRAKATPWLGLPDSPSTLASVRGLATAIYAAGSTQPLVPPGGASPVAVVPSTGYAMSLVASNLDSQVCLVGSVILRCANPSIPAHIYAPS